MRLRSQVFSAILALTAPLYPQIQYTVSTIAGGGTRDDGGPATAAGLLQPSGAVLDQAGNLYILDVGHNRIRRVDPNTGIITTVAGNGSEETGASQSPDGVLATSVPLSLRKGQTLAVDTLSNL